MPPIANHHPLVKYLLFLLLSAISTSLFAWGANGHRIVAQICYDHLTPEAQQRVDNALGDNYLAQVANWPDYIKSENNWDFAKPWHYMTVQPHETPNAVAQNLAQNQDIDNVQEGIELMLGVLRNETAAREQLQRLLDQHEVTPLAGSLDATALAFFIHFIGDIHQPMHVGKNRDLGGNKISVLYFGDRRNLHGVWDSDIIEHERLSYTEFADFVQLHTRARKAEWENDPIEDWIAESIELRERLYNTLYDNTDRETGLPNLSWRYQHDFIPIVEDRLGAAGYRAAALLNGIYS